MKFFKTPFKFKDAIGSPIPEIKNFADNMTANWFKNRKNPLKIVKPGKPNPSNANNVWPTK